MTAWKVPVIDLDPYRAGGLAERRALAERIGWACENVGFLIVERHGLPADLLERAFAVSREFFALPEAEKNRYRPANEAAPRGYHGYETINLAKTLSETTGQDAHPDMREQFVVGPLGTGARPFADIPESEPYYLDNLWPERPAAYRDVFTALYQAMEALSGRMMRCFALALGQPEAFFDDKIDRHFNVCPSNHYPPLERAPRPGQVRVGAHTDFGSLTILAVDDAPGGLQVRMPDGAWLDVRPAPGQLVVNIGDMMARWTNERWKSTLHRVIDPPAALRAHSRRQSIGYFVHPNYDAEVACIDGCFDAGTAPKYPPIRAGEYMREKLERRIRR